MTTFATAPTLAPAHRVRRTTPAWLLLLGLLAAALVGSALLLGTSPSPQPTAEVRNGLIAFDAGRDIWVVNPDGSQLRRLTETPEEETSPVWSPDGSRLAVWTTVRGVPRIAILGSTGSVERTISAPGGSTLPTVHTPCNALTRWSPDGNTLAATILTSRFAQSVGVIDVRTGDGRVLDVGMRVCAFAWSPVGFLLGLSGGDDGEERIHVVDPDGGELRALTPEGRRAWFAPDDGSPFTPDGAFIVSEPDTEDGPSVIVGLDRSERPLVAGGGASVSPDGRWVAFIRGEADPPPPGLYVVPMDGLSEPRLVSDEVCDCSPAWSPDGKLLATWTPSWEEVLILDAFGEAAPVRVPSPGNVGVLSWQAIRDG